MAKETDPVIFFDAEGNEISNDPRWIMKQQADALQAQVDAQAEVATPSDQTPVDVGSGGEDKTEDETEEDSESVDYSEMKADELKALAKDRELDLSGITKKSELVALLEANDAE